MVLDIKNKQRIDAYLANTPMDSDTVDLETLGGTVFQQKVWHALQTIPKGETRTYKQIASAINHPKAYRAVGSACGANPLAILIPCHRAVASNGGLGGFAWGLDVKKKLLAFEGAHGI